MLKVILDGNLGKDAQLVESMNGRKFLSFPIAVNKYRNNEQKTLWFSVLWFNYTPNMVQHLKKGKSVQIIGDFDDDIKIDTNGTTRLERTVVADSVNFLSFGSNTEKASSTTSEQPQPQKRVEAPSDDEISAMSSRTTTRQETSFDKEIETDLPF
jgi:single stranded DNA-binding protein